MAREKTGVPARFSGCGMSVILKRKSKRPGERASGGPSFVGAAVQSEGTNAPRCRLRPPIEFTAGAHVDGHRRARRQPGQYRPLPAQSARSHPPPPPPPPSPGDNRRRTALPRSLRTSAPTGHPSPRVRPGLSSPGAATRLRASVLFVSARFERAHNRRVSLSPAPSASVFVAGASVASAPVKRISSAAAPTPSIPASVCAAGGGAWASR
jgi:hypothetical protein